MKIDKGNETSIDVFYYIEVIGMFPAKYTYIWIEMGKKEVMAKLY